MSRVRSGMTTGTWTASVLTDTGHYPPATGKLQVEHHVELEISGLTVRIDRTLCVGFGDCVTGAPSIFELDDEGIAVFRAGGEISRADLLDACDACPVDAITVEDEDGTQVVP